MAGKFLLREGHVIEVFPSGRSAYSPAAQAGLDHSSDRSVSSHCLPCSANTRIIEWPFLGPTLEQ